MEVRARTQSTTLEVGTTEEEEQERYLLLTPRLNFSWLCYTAQGHLSRDCTAHSGRGSPTLITNQDKSSDQPDEENHTVTPSSGDSRLHEGDSAKKDSI